MFKYVKGALGSILFTNPLNARLWLTYKCNYACGMCDIRNIGRGGEMSLEELEVVAWNLKRMGASQIILTGGEPLLRSDIVDIVKIFAPHGFVTRIQTNGGPHATEDLLSKCYDAGLDDISISIDTLDAEKQDRICGSKDVLKNAMRVLKFCKNNYSHKGVVAADIVISAQNFFELPELMEFTNSLGVFFNPCILTRLFSRPSEHGEKKYVSSFDLTRLNPGDVEEIFRSIEEYIKKDYKILMSSRMLSDLKHYVKTGEYRWGCMAGLLSFDIMPSGELSPCCDTIDAAFEKPIANFKYKDFLTQYRNEEFQKKCEDRRERCPGCLYACYRDPKYLVSDFFVQLEALHKSIKFRKVFK
ncbi:MAG: radical SAM protein [Candidatus Omnitrophica bacterium]|nr:radical SAM protein [Candidatus Omnitrophota bacterium]